jgi:predicted SAM-dependent methyltransferase
VNKNIKLHLGCGQTYLKGYINIDFPLKEHSVQNTSVADKQIDLLKLKYPENSVEEIKIRHVFEHFTRPVACSLISKWHIWLKAGGFLHIEVPNFERTSKVVSNPSATDRKKLLALRHIFGSHEAWWANHYEGYTPKSLSALLKMYGFSINKIHKYSWKGMYNFEIFAIKTNLKLDMQNLRQITKNYLKQFLVDKSESELRLLSAWMNIYEGQTKNLL